MKKIVLLLSLILCSTHSHAFLSHGYNVEQLSSKANVIFMGEVAKIEESPATNNPSDLPFVQVRFKVYESLKGNVPPVFSFKQFAPKVGKQYQLLGMDKHAYVVGQKLVMFLGSPSQTTGLAAPQDFQLFMLQPKTNRQADIDQSVIYNKQLGDKIGTTLFQNLQKTNTLRLVEKMEKNQKAFTGVSYKNFRELIQASVK